MKVALLGHGQLGRALATALAGGVGHDLSIWTRRPVPAEQRRAGATFLAGDEELARAVEAAELVLLAVTDDAIPGLAARLAELRTSWGGTAVLHVSGARPAQILEPLAARGAAVGACHPLRAFPEAGPHEERPFAGAPFTVEGSPEGVEAARRLVRELGGGVLAGPIADRTAYHVAATVASNYGLLLRDWSARRFESAGLARKDAERAADALLRNALDNALAQPGRLPLTGPIRRGDARTVDAHVAALGGAERAAYAALGLLLLEAARPVQPGAAEIARRLRGALRREVGGRPAAEAGPAPGNGPAAGADRGRPAASRPGAGPGPAGASR